MKPEPLAFLTLIGLLALELAKEVFDAWWIQLRDRCHRRCVVGR